MELVTFQSMDALKDLLMKGYLECKKDKIDFQKNGHAYNWITKKMLERIPNPSRTEYPMWCWVKCFNGICPPKRKGSKVKDYDVKITFKKREQDVFITDFRRYSFVLNNIYIPNNKREKEQFDEKLRMNNINTEELKAYVRKDKYLTHRTDNAYLTICHQIEETFDRCITKKSDILQGCVWRIYLSEIEKIEVLPDDGYTYGSLNYIRSNGQRIDWQKDYYKRL